MVSLLNIAIDFEYEPLFFVKIMCGPPYRAQIAVLETTLSEHYFGKIGYS